jgi:hypothetical protein
MNRIIRCVYCSVEGSACSGVMSHTEEGDLEVALQLTEMDRRDSSLPNTATVTLSLMTWEEYLPPRCRKKRNRPVYTEIAKWTLGELRRLATEKQQ